MSDAAFEADRNISMKSDGVPQVVHQHAETDELSMNELDEANGGLFILYLGLCYMAGYGLAAMTERR